MILSRVYYISFVTKSLSKIWLRNRQSDFLDPSHARTRRFPKNKKTPGNCMNYLIDIRRLIYQNLHFMIFLMLDPQWEQPMHFMVGSNQYRPIPKRFIVNPPSGYIMSSDAYCLSICAYQIYQQPIISIVLLRVRLYIGLEGLVTSAYLILRCGTL